MILSIINVVIALVTLGIGYYNLKVVKEENNEKRKSKLFIPSNRTVVSKKTIDHTITIYFENVGENELIEMDIETVYSYIPSSIFSFGTLQPNEKKSITYNLNEIIKKHIDSKRKKSEFQIPITIGYFNKYFNTYIIENKFIDLVIEEHFATNDLFSVKTSHLYIESKKLNEYKS